MNQAANASSLSHATVTDLAARLAQQMLVRGQMLVTAESCTGGLIAAACTDLAGSSAWFERGFVTYSNEAKTDLLSVPAALIAEHGAVSEPVARAMATGALQHSRAHISVAVTGVAGPGGGSASKPVGTVWLAWATPHKVEAALHHFSGDRRQVREGSVQQALVGLLQRLA